MFCKIFSREVTVIFLLFSSLVELILYLFGIALSIFNKKSFLDIVSFRVYFLILALTSFAIFIQLFKKSSLKIKDFVNTFLKSFIILSLSYLIGEFIFYHTHKAFLGELIISSLVSVLIFLLYSFIYASCGFLHKFSKKYHYLFNFIVAIFIIFSSFFYSKHSLAFIILFLLIHILLSFCFINKKVSKLIILNCLISFCIFCSLSFSIKYSHNIFVLFFFAEFLSLYLYQKNRKKYSVYFLVFSVTLTIIFVLETINYFIPIY